MSFTDENLAELKELTKAIIYWSPKIPALIARLEAAETAYKAWQEFYWGNGNAAAEEKCDKADAAWRKAAGK